MTSFPLWWPAPSSSNESAENIWDALKSAIDVQQYKPIRAEGIISKEMTDGSGHHFILKNGNTHSYVRLSPQEFWLWEKMDGSQSVQQLVVAYFLQYKAFAFAPIVSLIERLREGTMLMEAPRHLYAEVSSAIQEQSLSHKLTWIARTVFTREFVIKNLDARMKNIHRYGGWLLFTWPVQLSFLLVSIIGLYFFVILARDPQYNLLNLQTALQLGLLAYIPLVIHEFGHAITAKHVGCEVYKGGAMLYYGMPAAFIDTTDVWMFSKRARLAVTWAGPYTGYIIGGACSLFVYFSPHLAHNTAVLILQIALTAIFTTTLNILPLLKLDGYYLLADALEIPRLRERSMAFITQNLRQKINSREKWTREEKIFAVFGVLAFLSTFYFAYAGISFWDYQATQSISELLNLHGDIGKFITDIGIILLAVSAIVYSLILLAANAKRAYHWLQSKGLFSTRGRAASIIVLSALALAYVPQAVLPTLAFWFLLLGGISAFAFASYLAFSNFISMRGSVHAWMWIPASGAALIGAGIFLGENDARWAESAFLAREASFVLFLISFLLAGRLLIGLRGSWRNLSLGLVVLGLLVLSVTPFFHVSIQENALTAFLILGGLLHWRMRPATQVKAVQVEITGSTREQMMAAFTEMKRTILSELEYDFGKQTRVWTESGVYRPRKAGAGEAEFSKSMTGMTPNDYGGALALGLEELLTSVERAAGRRYAWRALAYGYDRLYWELQEIAEDYLLKYVPRAIGLSNELSAKRDDLNALLRSVPLFMSMTDEEIAALCKKFKPRFYKPGEDVVRVGDAGDSFYILRAGRVEVIGREDFASSQYKAMDSAVENDHAIIFSLKERRLTQLGRGDYFGEFALLEDKPRTATVRAITPVEVLRLSRMDFNQLVRSTIRFDENAREEIRQLGVLRQIPLFAGFEGLELKMLAKRLEKVKLAQGQIVFTQGEEGDRFYIIESGKVSVQIDGQERATLGTGEYFGEIALLMNTLRTATVTSLQPLTLLQLRAEDFRELVQDSAAMKQALERASSRRTLANERWARQRQVN